MRSYLLLVSLGFLSACSFVKMAPGGDAVKVVAIGKDLSSCEKRGDITVSVKDRLGPYERDVLRVKDELEVLARNEAPGLKADTVQAIAEVNDGSQKWRAYRCSGSPAVRAEEIPDKAVTQPLKD
ncbi:MAG: DUF4156 domain-containing protein [Methylococcales bacterium]